MDDVASLRERIPSYAGYGDEDARRLADQQIRAYAGERIAALRDPSALEGDRAERLERLLFRCEFSDQRLIRAIELITALDAAALARIHALDRAIVDAADRAAGVEPDALEAYLATIDALFEDRASALLVAAPSH